MLLGPILSLQLAEVCFSEFFRVKCKIWHWCGNKWEIKLLPVRLCTSLFGKPAVGQKLKTTGHCLNKSYYCNL